MRIRNLSKRYNDLLVLDNISMRFEQGGCYCLMGQSGTGKTTLFRIILGLIAADSGAIDGIEGKKIAAVFQEDRLCEEFSAFENVYMVTDGIEKSDIREALEELLPNESIDRPVSTLSGGMKRRVAVVRALLAQSDLILMDEPFTGLDEETKYKVICYIKEMAAGKTLIISTHNEEDAELFGAEIIRLNDRNQ